MMMLPTGNRKGFTLIEIMVATAVLSLGLVLIFEAFFSSLDAFDYYVNYLNANNFVEEKIWEAQDSIKRFGSLVNIQTNGEIEVKNKKISWFLISSPLGAEARLFKINLEFSWKQGKRRPKINRCAYAKAAEE
jgi:prepilin-type N-terminal cleavage/methylation domain-containing protein